VIRVMLADDHRLVRAGLEQLLAKAEDLEVVGCAADGEEAVEMASDLRPDVILMDLVMPRADGIEATKRIRSASSDAPAIVVLTSFSDRDRILDALDAGAAGYLLKDCEPQELFDGVRAAASGNSPLAPEAARAMLTARADRRVARDMTDREREVLGLLRTGMSNKQMARRLGISEKTVKAHLTRVFDCIGVTDRTQAALWAERHHIGAPV
jgi:DNA-binding NarL/FixJ family response regulator